MTQESFFDKNKLPSWSPSILCHNITTITQETIYRFFYQTVESNNSLFTVLSDGSSYSCIFQTINSINTLQAFLHQLKFCHPSSATIRDKNSGQNFHFILTKGTHLPPNQCWLRLYHSKNNIDTGGRGKEVNQFKIVSWPLLFVTDCSFIDIYKEFTKWSHVSRYLNKKTE